jgi:hypothetical protein
MGGWSGSRAGGEPGWPPGPGTPAARGTEPKGDAPERAPPGPCVAGRRRAGEWNRGHRSPRTTPGVLFSSRVARESGRGPGRGARASDLWRRRGGYGGCPGGQGGVGCAGWSPAGMGGNEGSGSAAAGPAPRERPRGSSARQPRTRHDRSEIWAEDALSAILSADPYRASAPRSGDGVRLRAEMLGCQGIRSSREHSSPRSATGGRCTASVRACRPPEGFASSSAAGSRAVGA